MSASVRFARSALGRLRVRGCRPTGSARPLVEPLVAAAVVAAVAVSMLASANDITMATKLYHKCAENGLCKGQQAACPPGTAGGQVCRYCSNTTLMTYHCPFSLFDYCVHWTHAEGSLSCGERRVGICMNGRCIDSIGEGVHCARTLCLVSP